jgi:hypothetical protein
MHRQTWLIREASFLPVDKKNQHGFFNGTQLFVPIRLLLQFSRRIALSDHCHHLSSALLYIPHPISLQHRSVVTGTGNRPVGSGSVGSGPARSSIFDR